MKNIKKLIAASTIIGILGVVGVAGASYAAGTSTPAGIVSSLTGKSVEEITAQRTAGATYGTIANKAGKLDEFKAQTLEQKKLILDQRVENSNLTQAQADQIYNSIKTNQATCNGTSSAPVGKGTGVGFGQGMVRDQGQGQGQRNGGGFGIGMRNGFGVK